MSMLVWSSILVCIKVWVCVSLISPRVWDMRISGDLWPGVHSECEDSRTGQGLPANQSAPVQPVASNTLTLTLNCIHASLWVVQCESGTVQHRCSSRHHTHTPSLTGGSGRTQQLMVVAPSRVPPALSILWPNDCVTSVYMNIWQTAGSGRSWTQLCCSSRSLLALVAAVSCGGCVCLLLVAAVLEQSWVKKVSRVGPQWSWVRGGVWTHHSATLCSVELRDLDSWLVVLGLWQLWTLFQMSWTWPAGARGGCSCS